MTFQTTIYREQALGVIGELYDDGPHRAQPFILDSVSAANNVFGRAFSVKSEGVAEVGNPSAGVFAGILVNPKTSALLGTTSATLDPSLTLPNGAVASLLTMGSIVVELPDAAAIGDLVIFDNTTGILETISPGDALPAGKSSAHAVVDRFTVTAEGLAVIKLTDAPEIPVAAGP